MLYPDWSLLLVNMRGSLHCKQSIQFVRNTIIQLPVVYEAKSTTSCQYMASCYYRDKGKVESKVRPVTRLFLDGNAYLLVTPSTADEAYNWHCVHWVMPIRSMPPFNRKSMH